MSRTLLFAGCLGGDGHPPVVGVYAFDAAVGAATPLSETTGIEAPSFLAVDAPTRRAYVVSETKDGALVSCDVDIRTGKLSEIARQKVNGDSPCHVSLDRTRRTAFVANFGFGAARSAAAQSVTALPIEPMLAPPTSAMRHNGSGPMLPQQDGPHAHCAVASPDNRFVIVTDFGTDEIISYPFDQANGRLLPAASVCKLPPGAAPRTFAFGADGRTAFASAELMSSVATLDWDAATGRLALRAMDSTLPAGTSTANYPSEILLRRDGRFLYCGNRGPDSIAVFAVGDRLRLAGTYPTGGSWPRCFCQTDDGSGLIVANQRTGELVLFAADSETGALAMRGVIARVHQPAFVGLVTFD
jgi:6-phosphogluconolactonase